MSVFATMPGVEVHGSPESAGDEQIRLGATETGGDVWSGTAHRNTVWRFRSVKPHIPSMGRAGA